MAELIQKLWEMLTLNGPQRPPPKHSSSGRSNSGPSFGTNQQSQNSYQSHFSYSPYTCPRKGCTRTFKTIDDMNKHHSRHNGRNRRR
ncbi:hypothetical protein RhiirC2_729053 [Rhizophagus irregularis]|uniref:C2H2-type domain-containing protein n=1 Tax=Rhizophagus irregularis TaxID=588596 RepID=A0A2N1MLD4_9GLOM|nr:hypothetical protein RhiirC2_759560 [Rhizophagus irregularis]PKK78649.1 hypothetical protein RhiirC2_729053 [Rhizophagus irregularis]